MAKPIFKNSSELDINGDDSVKDRTLWSWIGNLWNPSKKEALLNEYIHPVVPESAPVASSSPKEEGSSIKFISTKKGAVIDICGIQSVKMVVFSLWDNISGPRVEQIWRILPQDPSLDSSSIHQSVGENQLIKSFQSTQATEIASRIAKYTLAGELLEYLKLPKTNSETPNSLDPLNIYNERFDLEFEQYVIQANLTERDCIECHKELFAVERRKVIDPIDPLCKALNIEYRMHVFNESDYFVISAIFSGLYEEKMTKFALSVAFTKSYFEKAKSHYNMIEDRMQQLISIYIYLIQYRKPSKAVSQLNQYTIKYIHHIEQILNTPVLPPPYKELTLFHKESTCRTYFEKLLPLFESHMWQGQDGYFKKCVDNEMFFGIVLTSFLQTHKHIVLISQDPDVVVLYIHSLSLFLSDEERERSSLINTKFVPDLYIQGLCIPVEKILTDMTIMDSSMPLTLVDIDRRAVYQTFRYHEYTILRKEYLKHKIQKMVKKSGLRPLWTPDINMFQKFTSCATCVRKILDELHCVSESYIQAFIRQYMKILEFRSHTLIKYVEALSEDNRNRLKDDMKGFTLKLDTCVHNTPSHNKSPQTSPNLGRSKNVNVDSLPLSTSKRIRRDLNLDEESFYILLSISEMLKPGVHRMLFGDDTTLQETRWVSNCVVLTLLTLTVRI